VPPRRRVRVVDTTQTDPSYSPIPVGIPEEIQPIGQPNGIFLVEGSHLWILVPIPSVTHGTLFLGFRQEPPYPSESLRTQKAFGQASDRRGLPAQGMSGLHVTQTGYVSRQPYESTPVPQTTRERIQTNHPGDRSLSPGAGMRDSLRGITSPGRHPATS